MAQATFQVQYRRSVRWTLAVMGVLVLKAIGLKMPKGLLLWCARCPGESRIGNGPWRPVRLDPHEIKRRFG